MKHLDLGDFTIPHDAVTETFGILAVRRAGKSNAAVVMAEEMYDAGLPWVAVDPKGDWWGVRAAGDGESEGLSVLVFGGLHGDVPLEPTAGRLVADLVAEQRLTCVLDVSEMSKADQRRFLTDFATRLYRRNTEPLHVFLEEADEYIPQRVGRDQTTMVGAFETLVKRGGFRGIGVTLITQRSASLNKDVLTQAGTLFAMRTGSPQDRKAIEAWIDYHAASHDVVAELPMLAAGEAWMISPHFLSDMGRVTFRRRRTFDSGATPKVGGKPRPPTRMAEVDVAAIKEAMSETIERAKADDPAELRKVIKRLERALRDVPAPKVETTTVEVPVVDPEVLRLVSEARDAAVEFASRVGSLLADVGQAMNAYDRDVSRKVAAAAAAAALNGPRPKAGIETVVSTLRKSVDASQRRRTADTPPPPRPRPAAVSGGLGKGETAVLAAVAQYPDGVAAEQLSVLTGYKRSSRNTYLQRLKAAGCVETRAGRIVATDVGVDTLGDDYEPLPTGAALRDHWLATLPEGERRILGELIAEYPEPVPGDDLDDRTGYRRSSRNTYLQRLRARQLVTTDSAGTRASDTLFLE